jgi:pimeloyl-ACP methyl ester carboxylesterase
MTVDSGRTAPFGNRKFVPQLWARCLCGMALMLVLGLSIASGAARAAAAAGSDPYPRGHVYLIRGFANIFSLGLDQIGDRLQQQGIHVSIFNHMLWPGEAEEAAADYKSGKVHTIILVGHSAGALSATSMAARLGELGVPVKLVIGLDPVLDTTASGHVGRYVNYYISGAVTKGKDFVGTVENVDVEKLPNIGHFNIDKYPSVQNKIIAQIRAALAGDRPAAPAATGKPGQPSSVESTKRSALVPVTPPIQRQ